MTNNLPELLPRMQQRMPREEFDQKVEDEHFYPHPTDGSCVIRFNFRNWPKHRKQDDYSWFQLHATISECYADENKPDTIVLFRKDEVIIMMPPLKIIEIELRESLLRERTNRPHLEYAIQRLQQDLVDKRKELAESADKEKQLLEAIETVKEDASTNG